MTIEENREEQNLYDDQITAVVRGFMLVWNRFESTLSNELSHIQERLQGMRSQGEGHPDTNYELFYRACNSIYPEGNITMGEFGNALSVPLSTATRTADWLVDNGFIERLQDPDDRRIVRVTLTEIGKETYREIDRYIRNRIQQVLSTLTKEEQAILLTLIGKVVLGLKGATK
ncbi:MarR family transcriptional regulator [Chloroflexota bacterium]